MAQEFYFAWVPNGNTTFGSAHHVQDEQVVGFRLDHQEREVPSLKIAVRNPKVGLLNASRMQWAWVSWRRPDNVVVPLFHGRLLAFPTDLVMEVVTLELIARPENYEAQKRALAETLKVAPYWDPIFIAEEELDNPDIVLQARPVLWHIGRTDKTVTVSNILNGEAGTVALTGAEVLGRELQIQYGQPIDKVKVTASVEWTQTAFGTVDMSQALRQEFGGLVASYTGQGLEDDWPPYGTDIGGGWSVDLSRPNLASDNYNKAHKHTVQLDPRNATPDFEIEDWWADSPEGFDHWYNRAYETWLAEQLSNPITEARFALWEFYPTFIVRYEASRGRKELMEFEVAADVQRLVTVDVDQGDPFSIDLSSTTVDSVLPNNSVRSYFETDRGQQSIAYMLNMVRCAVLMAARAVQITVNIPWLIGIQLSCRHDILLSLPELPGGQVGGKVVAYQLSMDPQTGQMAAGVTLAAVVGNGNTLGPPANGTESYVDDEYVGSDYQVFYGNSLQPVAGQIEYVRPSYKPADDDIDFSHMTPESVLLDLSATALFTFSGAGSNGETVTIGTRTYTLRNTLTAPNEVLLGSTKEATAEHLTDAIERTEAREGVTFGNGTDAHAQVGAVYEGAIVRVTARKGGVSGNSIAVSDTVAAGAWDQPQLYDGSDGLVVQGKPAQQEAHLDAEPSPGSVAMAIERLNEKYTLIQMALKPVTGGPFETKMGLNTSLFMVPKTIDLSAAPSG